MGSYGDDSERRYSQEFWEALGHTIKVLRTDQGVGRRELATRAGISYSYLTEIENGNKPPSSNVLGPIADALGLRMHRLIEAAEARLDVREAAQAPADARPLSSSSASGAEGPSESRPVTSQAAFPVTLAHEWLSRFGTAARSSKAAFAGEQAAAESHAEAADDHAPDTVISHDRPAPERPSGDSSARDRLDPRAPAWNDPAQETRSEPVAYLHTESRSLRLADRQLQSPDSQLREIRRPPVATPREVRSALAEFQQLLRRMSTEDIERLLDFARRLGR